MKSCRKVSLNLKEDEYVDLDMHVWFFMEGRHAVRKAIVSLSHMPCFRPLLLSHGFAFTQLRFMASSTVCLSCLSLDLCSSLLKLLSLILIQANDFLTRCCTLLHLRPTDLTTVFVNPDNLLDSALCKSLSRLGLLERAFWSPTQSILTGRNNYSLVLNDHQVCCCQAPDLP